MNKKVFILLMSLFLSYTTGWAQGAAKSELQQRAETEDSNGKVPPARFFYIRAYEDYVKKGRLKEGVHCGAKATALYYKESLFHEGFELLKRIDQSIEAGTTTPSENAELHYVTTRERFQMYMKMRRNTSAMDQLNIMENQANIASDESLKNDLLYNKAIYYYTFGQNAQGNAVFKEMADKLTADKEYNKVEEVYKTLIANGRRSNSANLVAQSYNKYMLWKDSVSALKVADEIGALKQQIADNEASIADKDSSLTARQWVIVALGILAIALAAALALGAIVLMRYIMQTRKQQKTINMLNENNALKAKFISNISAQLEPSLQKLDKNQPEVKALLDFSDHIQTLSALESSMDEAIETEDTLIPQYCESLIEQIRGKERQGVTLTTNSPKMSVKINKEYVSHILLHLLENAAIYTPEGGSISLEFKKRGPHKFQFLVSDTGEGIAQEKQANVFKPFLEIRNLAEGDGLGLPICKQMAVKMKGDLDIDASYTKGTRFVLDLPT